MRCIVSLEDDNFGLEWNKNLLAIDLFLNIVDWEIDFKFLADDVYVDKFETLFSRQKPIRKRVFIFKIEHIIFLSKRPLLKIKYVIFSVKKNIYI